MEAFARVAVSCRLRPALDPDLALARWELTDSSVILPTPQKSMKKEDFGLVPAKTAPSRGHAASTNRSGPIMEHVTETKMDHVFGEKINTKDIYETAYRPIVGKAVQGLNGCILAYGQTSSGKTYSMVGNDESKGIIEHACEDAFRMLEESGKVPGTGGTRIRFSLCEVYMEKCIDLLAPRTRFDNSLAVKECPPRGSSGMSEFYVEGLSEHDAWEARDVMEKIAFAERKRRKIAQTKYNEQSSRSHTVLTLTIEATDQGEISSKGTTSTCTALSVANNKDNEDLHSGGEITKVGKLVFVDLAGNERLDESMQYLQEGSAINLSLFFLSECVSKLSAAAGMIEGGAFADADEERQLGLSAACADAASSRYIPYRDSKLTRILAVHLGQNSHTGILVCLHPAEKFVEQSLCTLRFAQKASEVVSRVRPVYRSKNEELLQKLRKRVRTLEDELEDARAERLQTTESGQIVSGSKETDRIVLALNQANTNYKIVLTRYRNFLRQLEQDMAKRSDDLGGEEAGEGGQHATNNNKQALGTKFSDLAALERVWKRFQDLMQAFDKISDCSQGVRQLAGDAARKLALSSTAQSGQHPAANYGCSTTSASQQSTIGTTPKNINLLTTPGLLARKDSQQQQDSAREDSADVTNARLNRRILELEAQLRGEHRQMTGSAESSPAKWSQASSQVVGTSSGVQHAAPAAASSSTFAKLATMNNSSTTTSSSLRTTPTSTLQAPGSAATSQMHDLKVQNMQLRSLNKYLSGEKDRWKSETETAKTEVATLQARSSELQTKLRLAETALISEARQAQSGQSSSTSRDVSTTALNVVDEDHGRQAGETRTRTSSSFDETMKVEDPFLASPAKTDKNVPMKNSDFSDAHYFSGRVQQLLDRQQMEKKRGPTSAAGFSSNTAGTFLPDRSEEDDQQQLDHRAEQNRNAASLFWKEGNQLAAYASKQQAIVDKQREEIAVLRLEREKLEQDLQEKHVESSEMREKLGSVMAARRDADRNYAQAQKMVSDLESQLAQQQREFDESMWMKGATLQLAKGLSSTERAAASTSGGHNNSTAHGGAKNKAGRSSASSSTTGSTSGGSSASSSSATTSGSSALVNESLQKKNAELLQRAEVLQQSEKKSQELMAQLQRRIEQGANTIKAKDGELARFRQELAELRKALVLARKNGDEPTTRGGPSPFPTTATLKKSYNVGQGTSSTTTPAGGGVLGGPSGATSNYSSAVVRGPQDYLGKKGPDRTDPALDAMMESCGGATKLSQENSFQNESANSRRPSSVSSTSENSGRHQARTGEAFRNVGAQVMLSTNNPPRGVGPTSSRRRGGNNASTILAGEPTGQNSGAPLVPLQNINYLYSENEAPSRSLAASCRRGGSIEPPSAGAGVAVPSASTNTTSAGTSGLTNVMVLPSPSVGIVQGNKFE